ncbi:MAG: hypothetical protein Q7J27_13505 [Syntrophales bacterium]|nr:hypothetical protein [Syntrophales bacterium]
MLLSNHLITFHQITNYNKGNPMIRDELITEVRDALVRNYYNGMTVTEGKDRL